MRRQLQLPDELDSREHISQRLRTRLPDRILEPLERAPVRTDATVPQRVDLLELGRRERRRNRPRDPFAGLGPCLRDHLLDARGAWIQDALLPEPAVDNASEILGIVRPARLGHESVLEILAHVRGPDAPAEDPADLLGVMEERGSGVRIGEGIGNGHVEDAGDLAGYRTGD
jgi:hypothetical protein